MDRLSSELLARQRLDERHREGDLARLAAIPRERPALARGGWFGWPPRRWRGARPGGGAA